MAETSSIEWTDATWNPITGCSVVSPGCTNCYAMRLAGTRLAHHPSRQGLTRETKAGPVWTGEVRFNEGWLTQPLGWKRPRRIFVCAHGDLFAEEVPDFWIDRVFAVMALASRHSFQVLTKRSARMRAYCGDPTTPRRLARLLVDMCLLRVPAAAPIGVWPYDPEAWPVVSIGDADLPDDITIAWPLPNIWLGVSAEDQPRADARIPDLLATPAALRFVSAEPLLGPIDLTHIREASGLSFNSLSRKVGIAFRGTGLDWVIVGGESGRDARPMHPDWVRSLRDQCLAAGTPFFFKQWGAWAPRRWKADGGTHAMRVTALDGGCFQPIRSHPDSIDRVEPAQEGWQAFAAVGKKSAGRLLDGVQHDAIPGEV